MSQEFTLLNTIERHIQTDNGFRKPERQCWTPWQTLFVTYKELCKFLMFWNCKSKGKNFKKWFAEEQHGQQEGVIGKSFFPRHEAQNRRKHNDYQSIWALWPGWASWAQSEDRQFRFDVVEDWGTAKNGERQAAHSLQTLLADLCICKCWYQRQGLGQSYGGLILHMPCPEPHSYTDWTLSEDTAERIKGFHFKKATADVFWYRLAWLQTALAGQW